MTTFADLTARGSLLVSDGYRTKVSELGRPGYPVLRVAEVGDGIITPSIGDHVREEYRGQIGAKLSQAGDVLLTTKGTVGRRAIVPASDTRFVYSPQLCFFRVLDQTIDNRWLYYWLGGADFWSQALGVSQQTDMAPYVSLRDLRAIHVDLPPAAEQRAIAATLGALDDKIESNRRACDALHRLVNLHFKQTVERHTVDSIALGEIATITKGRSYKGSELQESATALVTLKSFDRNGGYRHDGLKPYIGPFRAEQVVNPGELVVAQTDLTQGAEVVGRGVRVPPVSEFSLLVASLDLAIVRPQPPMPVEYLFGLLSSEAFRQHCRSRVTGTTVLHLAKDAMPTWAAPVVPVEEQLEFAGMARVLLERMDALNHESARLTGVRDALLPELLSGRIHAPHEGLAIAESSCAPVVARSCVSACDSGFDGWSREDCAPNLHDQCCRASRGANEGDAECPAIQGR